VKPYAPLLNGDTNKNVHIFLPNGPRLLLGPRLIIGRSL